MMGLLVLNVTYYIRHLTFRIGECAITLLPGKRGFAKFIILYPLAACFPNYDCTKRSYGTLTLV